MTPSELEAIRARDAEMTGPPDYPAAYRAAMDRQDLLAYVDELRSRLASTEKALALRLEDQELRERSLRERMADLEAERALIIQRAENAEAALETCDLLRIEAMNAWLAAAALLREARYGYRTPELLARIDAHLARKP